MVRGAWTECNQGVVAGSGAQAGPVLGVQRCMVQGLCRGQWLGCIASAQIECGQESWTAHLVRSAADLALHHCPFAGLGCCMQHEESHGEAHGDPHLARACCCPRDALSERSLGILSLCPSVALIC